MIDISTVIMKLAMYYFIQCEKCYEELDGCCSNSCKDIYVLPVDEQKKIRKGYKNKTRFFKKGRLSERV